MALTLEERRVIIAERNKEAQIEIALGISKTIADVFHYNCNRDAFLSEREMVENLNQTWSYAIERYLSELPKDKYDRRGFTTQELVPVVLSVDTSQREGVVNIDPSPVHKLLITGDDSRNVLSRDRINMYLHGECETIYQGGQPTDIPTITDVVVSPNHYGFSRFEVRGCLYGVVDDDDVWRPLGDLESICGSHTPPESPRGIGLFQIRGGRPGVINENGDWSLLGQVDYNAEPTEHEVKDMWLVTWDWVVTHPDELRVGMIAYPSDKVPMPGIKLAIYQGNDKWLTIPYITE